jgi:hypothetical protein
MKSWVKGGIIGLISGFVLTLLLLIPLFLFGGREEGAGLAFVAILVFVGPFLIISLAIIFSFVWFLGNKLSDSSITPTKKGLLVGICLALIILLFGAGYIMWRNNLPIYGLFSNSFNPFTYEGEDFMYTLLFSAVFLIGVSVIGWIIGKIKGKYRKMSLS